MNTFTVQDGLNVQTNDLYKWQKILKKEVYLKVLKKCQEENKKDMKNGYDVFRGDSITHFILKLR